MNRRELERQENERRVELLHERIEELTPLLELSETPQWGVLRKMIECRRAAIVDMTHAEHDAARILKMTGQIAALAWVLAAVVDAPKRVSEAAKERQNIRERLGI